METTGTHLQLSPTSDFSLGAFNADVLQHFHWAETEKWVNQNVQASPSKATYVLPWDKGATNQSFHIWVIKLWQQKNCFLSAREVRPIKKNGKRRENELKVISPMPSCKISDVFPLSSKTSPNSTSLQWKWVTLVSVLLGGTGLISNWRSLVKGIPKLQPPYLNEKSRGKCTVMFTQKL